MEYCLVFEPSSEDVLLLVDELLYLLVTMSYP